MTNPTDSSPPSSPSHVASRNGAAENAVTLSNASRSILLRLYFVVPAARSARTYFTSVLGNPSHGITSRKTRPSSGRAFTASMTRRETSRKSPASNGMSLPTRRHINR
ncbi:hypothetical protein EV643_11419 [Kribbella sp. VKM Ac-2527]|uniref:Uncharacterized protein n=1 Tax=Kribbella caucasensis TaxID=2512215 RepID=A0A4V6PT17_9ACTN|nr:hypothetical protein [Kribbella sp. VKM Ac-2527]TDO44874.1 hypothetical protein EV643_11419 [Kribbella sp. VKM Ac-2527]